LFATIPPPGDMIFFTTSVQLIRHAQDGTERRSSSPARLEGNTLRLPIGTEIQIGDYVEHHSPYGESRILTVIDVIHPHMSGASTIDDYIEVTCVSTERLAVPDVTTPSPLHWGLSSARKLAEDGRLREAILEATRLVERRIRALTDSDDSRWSVESMFGAWSPMLDIKTTAADPSTEETFEYLELVSMMLRRLDRA
jgi:hypothetical protein